MENCDGACNTELLEAGTAAVFAMPVGVLTAIETTHVSPFRALTSTRV